MDVDPNLIDLKAENALLKRRVISYKQLIQISQVLSSTLELVPLLQLIIQTAADSLGTEAASLMLVDERTGGLHFAASSGTTSYEELSKIEVPIEGSIAGAIYKSGEPLIVNDAGEDPRHFGGVDRSVDFDTRTLLGVPLRLRNRVIGVLEALNKLDSMPFDEQDVEILLTLASQAAVAIDNARMVKHLRDANRRLSKLDELKTNFLSIASHELRTPLMIVQGYASFLQQNLDSGEMSTDVDMVLRGVKQLQDLIETMTNLQYLEAAGIELEREKFVLQELVQEVQAEWEVLTVQKQQTVRLSLPAHSIQVIADRPKIRLVVTNLLNNAVSFTPEGGHIEISMRPHTGMVAVAVADTGTGIPADELENIFKGFHQVENPLTRHQEGLGLGLAIARRIVELHDGRIWAESVLGRGSRFTFTLPIVWEV
ncbi:MAG: GAF domain-containing protein [Anaerolineae bacterium]|nr:GAF domain-containing protein [Anaerolineae bacterium]